MKFAGNVLKHKENRMFKVPVRDLQNATRHSDCQCLQLAAALLCHCVFCSQEAFYPGAVFTCNYAPRTHG